MGSVLCANWLLRQSCQIVLAFAVTGQIVDPDGRPVEGATISARRWREQSNRLHLEAKSDGDGHFELKNAPADRWMYRIEAEGYMPAESRVFQPYAPDKGKVTYDFKLSKAPQLTGTVLGVDGKPLAGANVYLATERMNIQNRTDVYSGTAQSVQTDADGRFELNPEVEPFCLVVVHEQGVAMITEKECATPPELKLEPWNGQNQQMQIIRRPTKNQSVDFPQREP